MLHENDGLDWSPINASQFSVRRTSCRELQCLNPQSEFAVPGQSSGVAPDCPIATLFACTWLGDPLTPGHRRHPRGTGQELSPANAPLILNSTGTPTIERKITEHPRAKRDGLFPETLDEVLATAEVSESVPHPCGLRSSSWRSTRPPRFAQSAARHRHSAARFSRVH